MRWIQPWLIALAILAILFALYLAAAVRPTPRNDLGDSRSGLDQAERLRQPIDAALNGLPALNARQDEGNTLPLVADVEPKVVQPLLAELNRSGHLGTNDLTVAAWSVEDFWRRPWPHDASLVGTGTGDVRLVGTVANQGNTSYVAARRWLGVFRKRRGQWQVASASDGGFYPPSEAQSVSLRDIPLTLKPVLPKPEPSQ